MKTLTPAQRRFLSGEAHPLNPVVMIGKSGLSPSVLKEIDTALKSHELIKIKVQGAEKEERESLLDEICAAVDAVPVKHIGKTLVIYRPAAEPKLVLP